MSARRRFKCLKSRDERFDAAVDVSLWGYPRELNGSDLQKEVPWFRLGPDIVFWAQPLVNGDLCVHVCSNPKIRSAAPQEVRRFFHTLEFLGDLMGCNRLIASDCTTGGEVASYLQRMGWVEAPDLAYDGVWYQRLLGEKHVQTGTAEDSHAG